MYRIRRFSALDEKGFSERSDALESLLKQCNKFTMEFIKCMEMYSVSEQNLHHWISGALGSFGLNNIEKKYFTYSTVLSRCIMDPNMLSNSEVSSNVSNLYGKNYINSIKSEIVSDRKYPSLRSMTSFVYDNEYYSRVLSIFMLVLNKSVDVDYIDVSSIWDSKFDNFKVDVTKDKVKVNYSDIELRRLLSRFIYHLNSDSGFLGSSDFIL